MIKQPVEQQVAFTTSCNVRVRQLSTQAW